MMDLAVRDELLDELPEQRQVFLVEFRELLVRWNQRFNLTAVRERADIDGRLISDALRLLPALDAEIVKREHRIRVIDLGTGAGLPGLVLKIARPDIDITLADASNKKVQFVQTVITELGLKQARAVHGRAEDLGQHLDYREQFDVVTARGVALLPILVELTLPLLVIGGVCLFPKGADLDDELRDGQRAASVLGGRIESAEMLPGIASEPVTRLVRGIKMDSTPGRYPRRAGIPSKEPLGRDGQ